MNRRGWSGRAVRSLTLLVFLALLALAGYRLWRVGALVGDILQQSRVLGESDTRLLSPVSENNTTSSLAALSADFRALRGETGPFLAFAPLLRWFPLYGGDLAQAPTLLDLGENASSGAQAALALFQVLSHELQAGQAEGQPLGTALVHALGAHRQEAGRARELLMRAEQARLAVDVSSLSPSLRARVERIDHLLSLAASAAQGLTVLPDFLGASGARQYLLLVQNSDELRPTGGFISSIVRLEVQEGDVQGIEALDSYAVDNPAVVLAPPPPALNRYLFANGWSVRDANWSPDFPTTARDAARLYTLARAARVDGVIGVNQRLVPALLQATGPLQVEGYEGTFDADNVVARLQESWAPPPGQAQTGDWWAHRKDLANKLLAALLQRLREGDVDRGRLVEVLVRALESRELLVYLMDAQAQGLVAAAGWGGALAGGPGDALMLVDSNVGFNKVDPSISRSAQLELTLQPNGRSHARLDVLYSNLSPDIGALCQHQAAYLPTYVEMQQGCYWDYVRVVASPGARLIAVNLGDDGLAQDPIAGRTVLSGYLVLPRGQSRQVEFEYESPAVITNGNEYQLRLEKQPGVIAFPWHITVRLPADWTAFRVEPPPQKVSGTTLEYDLVLDADWRLTVRRTEELDSRAIGLGLGGIALISLGWLSLRRKPRKD